MLGKLGAAVGITTAAASALLVKANPSTTPKAKIELKSRSQGASRMFATSRAHKCQDLNDDLNAYTNMRIDEMVTRNYPEMMVVPPSVYDFMRAKEAIRKLDPYNWGAVFDLEWHDFRAKEAAFATQTGGWEATVKPQFRGVFKNEVYYKTQSIAMDCLVSMHGIDNVDKFKEHTKDQCYRQIVDKLQDIILERIKRNVKDNGVEMPRISSRNTAILTDITD